MGFCLLNATAVAARWAQLARGAARVAILDWDVHHGNGTEAIFRDDASVLTVSLHQDRLYPPDTGAIGAPGEAIVNVPLPPGTGDAGYELAFERVVEPAIRAFGPDLLLIGAGQDAAASDPLGRMAVTVPGFRAWTERAVALAEECCGGRLVAFLEGGYSLRHLPAANLAILEAMAGRPPSFEGDPVGCDVPEGLREVERAAVEAAAADDPRRARLVDRRRGRAGAAARARRRPRRRRRGGRRRLHRALDRMGDRRVRAERAASWCSRPSAAGWARAGATAASSPRCGCTCRCCGGSTARRGRANCARRRWSRCRRSARGARRRRSTPGTARRRTSSSPARPPRTARARVRSPAMRSWP